MVDQHQRSLFIFARSMLAVGKAGKIPAAIKTTATDIF